jgi:hypothetical protein
MSQDEISRRRFLKLSLAAGAMPAILAAAGGASAADLPHLDEKDPTATALGYTSDTTKTDDKKFPNHKPDQMCSGCNLAQGNPTDAWRPCTIFPGKSVNSKGWCSAWVKKA